MIKIRLIKDNGNSLDINISKQMADKLIDLLYPDKGIIGISKGYVELVNFVYLENK